MKGQMKSKQEVIAKFKQFDADNSGTLDSAELAKLTAALGSSLSLNELESALFILDTSGDGKVSLEEFLAWWEGKEDDTIFN